MIIHLLRNRSPIVLKSRFRARSRFTFQTNAMATGIDADSPVYFAQTAEGDLFISNGIDAIYKWDGFAPQLELVGVAAPEDALTIAVSGIGTISGDYVAYQRFIDEHGNPSNFSPVSNTITARNNDTVTYTNVPVPTDDKIVKRQILRNAPGQQATFFVDVETEDLGNDTFESTRTEAELKAQTRVDVFSNVGAPIADVYGTPPDHKPFLVQNNDRMFAMGHVVYKRGCCIVTNGSATVTGVATQWKETFAFRRFAVVGSQQAYTILSVDETAQTLTLDQPWVDESSNFAVYSIAPFPAERRLIYFTEAGLPEAWSRTNSLPLTDDNDEITGGFDMNSYMFVTEREHTYRFTMKSNPAQDGGFFPAYSRGSISPRTVVIVEDTAYVMDRKGVYSFDGGNAATPISTAIQDMFRPDGDRRINWNAAKQFHAAHFPSQETVRFFVCLSGERLPRHALCYCYSQKGWWIEEFPFPVSASCVAYMDIQRSLLGGDVANVLSMEVGPVDVATPGLGTLRGTVTDADCMSLTDSAATFDSSIVGAPIAIVGGRGKDQSRRITSVSSGRIVVDHPWLTIPSADTDEVSTYQIGAIEWQWRTGWNRYVPDEVDNVRAVELFFKPLSDPASVDMRFYEDHATTPTKLGLDYNSDGVRYDHRGEYFVVDLTTANGFAMMRLDDAQELYEKSPNLIALDFHGFSGEESPIVYHVSVLGVNKGE